MWLRHPSAHCPPHWAPAGTQCAQMLEGGCICDTHQAIGAPPDDGWADAGGGWEIALLVGEIPQARDIRRDQDCSRVRISDGTWCPCAIVADVYGNPWPIPIALRPDGRILVERRAIKGPTGWEWIATGAQEKIITAGKYFAGLASAYEAGGDIECDAESAAELAAAAAHISAEAMCTSGLLDAHMISRIWIACIGGAVDDGEE